MPMQPFCLIRAPPERVAIDNPAFDFGEERAAARVQTAAPLKSCLRAGLGVEESRPRPTQQLQFGDADVSCLQGWDGERLRRLNVKKKTFCIGVFRAKLRGRRLAIRTTFQYLFYFV